ncbi:hypothetical protein FHX42_000562 [Saccharopolyspora lacisalsi]|uniref:Uncharacterized protein n=1 Tax=Halosaccharopolyspora lacisalsi TaxID=1000566 RepID=A0A839DQ86_9PSEU|nr:hypothetical protein [Halosaccharopolyspora lacisalsi]MBA8823233.1 hypothetical protein [Halosaccharopolyspora lacisalsi]
MPQNPAQAGMHGAGVVVPGLALGVPLWNAVESGIEEDQAAQAEQGKSA